MKSFLKKYQAGLKAFGVLFLTLVVVFLVIYLIFFNTTYLNFIQVGDIVDNNLRNAETENDFITVADGKIYLSVYDSVYQSGVYEISPPIVKCVLKENIALDQFLPGVSYVYKNKSVERFWDERDQMIEIKTLPDLKTLVSLDNSKYHVYGYFTFENELYFYTEDGTTVYRYNNGNMDIVASDELCGQDFVPLQYYKGDLYFCYEADEWVGGEYNLKYPLKLYQYSLSDRKILRQLDLRGMEEIFQQHCDSACDYLICDDCIYYIFDAGDVYRYDFDSKKAVELIVDGSYICTYNAYGNNAYIATKSAYEANNCLYVLSKESDEPKKMKDGLYREIAIIDKQWVYLYSNDGHIYRITPDGKDYQKVF